MPSYYIERRVILFRFEKLALKLADYSEVTLTVLIRSNWGEEIAGICEPVCPNRPLGPPRKEVRYQAV